MDGGSVENAGAIFDYRTSCTSSLLAAVAADSCPLATLIRPVCRPCPRDIRPPRTAEMSELQEPFPTVHPRQLLLRCPTSYIPVVVYIVVCVLLHKRHTLHPCK